MENTRPILSLKNATFRLGDRLVFQNTTWQLRHGQHWAIVGTNGSGKSLLGDALRGHLPLVEGELAYGFSTPQGLTPDQCIGQVSFEHRKSHSEDWIVQSRWNAVEQDHALEVTDYLSFERIMKINPFEVRKISGVREFSHRRNKTLRLLGIEDFLTRRLMTLSNGERQKVELARALCLPLRILILDEPFIGLDAASQNNLTRMLHALMKRLTVILISAHPDPLPAGITNVMTVEHCKVKGTEVLNSSACQRTAKIYNSRDRSAFVLARQCSGVRHRRATFRQISCSRRSLLIDVRDVTVRYGHRTILDRVNWQVRQNENWALIGPNGSGKTTLLSLITGDNPQAYSNHVVIFGRQRGTGESIWEVKRQIGWISPELQAHFQDHITCLETVESGFHESIGLYEPVTSKQQKLAREWLERFEMAGVANEPLFVLSTGLQRMVLLARALVKNPKLLVLDEPCQGLDERHRTLFLTTLGTLLRARKETAIYVTHQPDEIVPEITRILELPAPE